MSFNSKLFYKQTIHSLLYTKGTPARLTPRRVLILVIFFPLLVFLRFFNVISFWLDDQFHKDYQQHELHQPVFILGNARSGTTFLHRLMARDRSNFSFMRMWEVYFAPSVTQRKIFWFVQRIDRWLGRPMQRRLAEQEKQSWFNNPIHKIGLMEAEEDESILFNIWSSIFTSVIFPHPELVREYAFFDKSVPRRERRQVMRFYKACLQRHLYAHGSEKKLLSKNPTFSPKVDSLYEFFPDAKIIYLVRNPMNTIPSLISWMSFQWKQFCDPAEEYLYKEYLMDLAEEWYRYPLERFKQAPLESYFIVRYEDMVKNPDKKIREIYEHFGFEVSNRFARILRRETRRAKRYKSKHQYSLKKMGLSKQRILKKYEFVFDRFNFELK
jgi:hypothetical protein